MFWCVQRAVLAFEQREIERSVWILPFVYNKRKEELMEPI